MINISNMRKGSRGAWAIFDVEVDGWAVRGGAVVQRPDGKLAVRPPLLRDGRQAVQIPCGLWFSFVRAAMAAYPPMLRQNGGNDVCTGTGFVEGDQ